MNLTPSHPILLIDDEETWLPSFSLTLRAAGLNNIMTCSEAGVAMDMLRD